MRLYSRADEVRVHVRRAVRTWTGARLLSAEQRASLETDLGVGLRRTGVFLRAGLALFTLIAGAAAVGLVMLVTDLRSDRTSGFVLAALGAAALAGADWFVRTYRLYRHGVEEALAMGGVGLVGVGIALLAGGSSDLAPTLGFGASAAASVFVYRRFGFQYAAVLATVCAAFMPMPLDGLGREVRHLLAAGICAAAVGLATSMRRAATDDVALADAEVLRGAAVAGAYLALNLHILSNLIGGEVPAWFRWLTYAAIWAIPLAGLLRGIAERDRVLLRVSAVALLGSLLTNKSYLGWPREPWDPIVLGVLLIGIAVALRRWLESGSDSARNGFTAARLLESDEMALQLMGTLSVAVQPTPVRQVDTPDDAAFSGGRSGGGGAGGEF